MKVSYFFLALLLLFSCNTKQSIQSNNNLSYELITSFGADSTGKKDSSTAFKRALASKKQKIVVPLGTYRVDKEIEIKKAVFLESGVKIIRLKESNNNRPIFWLSSSNASLKGADKSASIATQLTHPEGVVKIGHKNQSWKIRNILYCEVSNLTILGTGSNLENKNTAIFLFSSMEKKDKPKKASFFHTLQNLVIQNFDTAIHLQGASNANSISNIILNRVGNSTNDYAIILDGAMENRIYDFHHHHSPNSTTLLLKDYMGFSPVFNTIFGAVSEPGGTSSRCLEARSGSYNNITMGCNNKKGIKKYPEFKNKKNIVKSF